MVCLSKFEFSKYILNDNGRDIVERTLSGKRSDVTNDYRFPDKFDVRSHITGKVVRFVKVSNEVAEQNEWWDGELYEYVPEDPSIDIRYLVLWND